MLDKRTSGLALLLCLSGCLAHEATDAELRARLRADAGTIGDTLPASDLAGADNAAGPDVPDAAKADASVKPDAADATLAGDAADATPDTGGPPCAPPGCDDGDPCTLDACKAGVCSHTTAADGAACPGDACMPSACEAGACVPGAPQLFDDDLTPIGATYGAFADVATLADGSFAVAGSYGQKQPWLARLDGAGKVLWSKEGTGEAWVRVAAAKDGGILALGATKLQRFGADGSPGWTAAGVTCNSIGTVVAMADGGAAVAGHLGCGQTVGNGPAVTRLSPSGAVVWQKPLAGLNALSNSNGSGVLDAAAEPDGGLLVFGWYFTSSYGDAAWAAVRLDVNGDQDSLAKIPLLQNQGVARFALLGDGTFLAVGSQSDGFTYDCNGTTCATSDARVVHFDAGGNILWSKSFGKKGILEAGVGLVATPDGGMLLAATISQQPAVTWLLRLGAGGVVLWDKKLSKSGVSAAVKAVAVAQGGAILAGAAKAGWVVRFDAFGNTACTDSGACFSKGFADCDDSNACTLDGCTAAAGCR